MESSLAPSMADYVRARCGRFADRVVVLDRLPHRQLYPVIAGAHLVVLPSLIENFPNACLEAMGLGKVVIGTVGTSFDELISDGATGFLVSPDNPEALADKLISAWIDPQLDAMGAAARETTLQFAPEITVETLLAYYRDILRSRGRASAERVTADSLLTNESVSNDVS
jgi:glycosyltransferase involved in cell wall biosynthesis